MLDALLAPLVRTAVQACRAANEASHVMVAAQQRLQAAVTIMVACLLSLFMRTLAIKGPGASED